MLNFLKKSRSFINASESICIVIGNESCDLDSAVSAVSLAYFYQEHPHLSTTKKINFLPLLNIPRADYPLKTEVNHQFGNAQISAECLTFRDELTEDFIARSDFILVDHHVSEFASRCIEVFDHRPIDENSNLPSICKIHIELVGSCATLIAEFILKSSLLSVKSDFFDILNLLRSTIILDTVNFSTTAARATAKDHQVCDEVEKVLASNSIALLQRQEVFQSLCNARADTSSLTALQLLRKDLKIISSSNETIRIALPGFPLSVQQFIEKPSALEYVRQFAREFNCSVILLMGLWVPHDSSSDVQRDIGFISISNSKLCDAIRDHLLNEPSLGLQRYEKCNFMNGQFYRQQNIKITRKHILPLVKELLEQWQTNV